MSVDTRPRVPGQIRAVCVGCVRSARSFTGRYRQFLLDPGTLFTLAALVLLVLGGIQHPAGLLRREGGLWVTSTRGNSLQLLGPSGRVEQAPAVPRQSRPRRATAAPRSEPAICRDQLHRDRCAPPLWCQLQLAGRSRVHACRP